MMTLLSSEVAYLSFWIFLTGAFFGATSTILGILFLVVRLNIGINVGPGPARTPSLVGRPVERG